MRFFLPSQPSQVQKLGEGTEKGEKLRKAPADRSEKGEEAGKSDWRQAGSRNSRPASRRKESSKEALKGPARKKPQESRGSFP